MMPPACFWLGSFAADSSLGIDTANRDLVEVGFFIAGIVFYRHEKLHMKIYVVEKVLMMIALNTSIFAV